MERNLDFDSNFENDLYKDPLFNPMMQYEQAYMYYRYLTQQVEYKIKCKELDAMGGKSYSRDNRRIE